MNTHPKKLLSYTPVRDMLQEQGGLTKREATESLKRRQPPPFNHGLHKRQRWSPKVVIDFCERLQNGDAPLGKGVPDANANS